MTITNKRIDAVEPMLAPQELFQKFPISDAVSELIQQVRSNISEIIHRRSNRFLVVVGPCSIHDTKAAIEYATRLSSLRQQYQQQLEIVMRVYFEKPRTTIGWKGLINDPELNGSYNVNKGLQIARELLIDINELGVPAGCEFLDAITAQYYADLVSWGAIGARTTESQIHRELASGLSCPIGFKNGTNGNVDIAADAVIAAKNQHVFPGLTEQGNSALFTTAGNHDGHVILRGGSEIFPEDLPAKITKDNVHSRDFYQNFLELPESGIDLKNVLNDIEDSLIIQALQKTNGNKNQASKLLSMNRTTLIEKMKKKKKTTPN